jgi:hypothetical protein
LYQNDHQVPYVQRLFGSTDPEVTVEINLWLYNSGNKTARDAKLFLWLPWPDWKVPDWDGRINPKDFFATQGLQVIKNEEIDKRRYWHATVDLSSPSYPGVSYIAHTFRVVSPLPYDGEMLWRIGYDDGITPAAELPPARMRFMIVRKP